jgi:hypothetical protein
MWRDSSFTPSLFSFRGSEIAIGIRWDCVKGEGENSREQLGVSAVEALRILLTLLGSAIDSMGDHTRRTISRPLSGRPPGS